VAKKIPITKMAIHISDLCETHGITVGSHSRGGRAFKKRRHINIRSVKTSVTYAMALHEIGHIIGKRRSGRRIDSETGAWEWAKENALTWTQPMNKTMVRSLQSYIAWTRRHVIAKEPDDSHPVWELLDAGVRE